MKIFRLISLLVMGLLAACAGGSKSGYELTHFVAGSSPASAHSLAPYLFTDATGTVHLSWIEKDETSYRFKTSVFRRGSWTEGVQIAADTNWFVNWADYPMIVSDGDQHALSHTLLRSGGGYAYDVQLFSRDGTSPWKANGLLNTDSTKSEHGFVSMTPWKENILMTWLDGRNTVGADTDGHSDGHGHHGAMTIRAAVVDYGGKKLQEWELDARTCDCCQTNAAVFAGIPTVLYRDRSQEEVRDIYFTQLKDGTWTTPRPVYNDGWTIAGCPVNGPRAAVHGTTMAAAWFTAPAGDARVNVAFMTTNDSSFAEPFRIDNGDPIGRVDVAMIDDDNAMVTWMEGDAIRTAIVNKKYGGVGESIELTKSSSSRSAGFPQLEVSGGTAHLAWTNADAKTIEVATFSVKGK